MPSAVREPLPCVARAASRRDSPSCVSALQPADQRHAPRHLVGWCAELAGGAPPAVAGEPVPRTVDAALVMGWNREAGVPEPHAAAPVGGPLSRRAAEPLPHGGG